ncbi:MAG: hypothetical protein GY941_19005 [Planctomycetes bacterium]|nr:hypothetical protein [Planctomycetota bacterium]
MIMCDVPHAGSKPDNDRWKARREMAAEWTAKLSMLPSVDFLEVSPPVTYLATKGNNQDLPELMEFNNINSA